MSHMKRVATAIMLDTTHPDCPLIEIFEELDRQAATTLRPAAASADHVYRVAREIAEAAGRDEPNTTDEQDALDLIEAGYGIENLPAAFWNDRRQRMVWCS